MAKAPDALPIQDGWFAEREAMWPGACGGGSGSGFHGTRQRKAASRPRTRLSVAAVPALPCVTVSDVCAALPPRLLPVAAGQRFCLQVKDVLHHEKSEYQVRSELPPLRVPEAAALPRPLARRRLLCRAVADL